KMWSFPEGMRVLIETLAARLRQPPVYGAAVRRIERHGDPAQPVWIVRGEGKDYWDAAAVVLTCPAYQQAVLLPDMDAGLSNEAAAIAYNRVAVVGLGFRRGDIPLPLDGFGFIAPQRCARDVLGVQWCSSIYPGRA